MNNVVLVILDGWGSAKSWGGNAITIAQTPNFDKLLRTCPNTLIAASGTNVGLPGHEMGNSEVGHMNIGAGRVIRQDISEINETIIDGSFYRNKVLKESVVESKNAGSSIHLIGIISDGGIHSHIVHLLALIKLCSDLGHDRIFIHAFTDGRDTDPMSGLEFINKLTTLLKKYKNCKIATILGRTYLDRKGDWPKTKIAYDALVGGIGNNSKSPLSAVSAAYKRGQTDEFIAPTIIEGAEGQIKDGDCIILFNFRSDRTRQLVSALFEREFTHFKRRPIIPGSLVTFVPYGIEMELKINAKSAFPTITVGNTLSSFFEKNKMRQFHIAETEKYPHVTYFFNGNRENPHLGEDRMIIPSPDVSSYAEKPEMSGEEVKEGLISAIKRKYYNFIVCNFANPDMVGHTGNFNAAVKAVEFVDQKVKEVLKVCKDESVPLVITADHGNIEQMVDPATGNPYTEHTNNPVPIIVVAEEKIVLSTGCKLANVAQTCLQLAGLRSEKFDSSVFTTD